MGVTIYANGIEQKFDCGYIGFKNLRDNIAEAYDSELGELYSDAVAIFFDSEAHTAKINSLLQNSRFKDEDSDIIDFFFMSDCEGKIGHKTCKKIYDLIRNIDYSGRRFTYAAHSDGKDYEHFKIFLKECYRRRAKMRWN